MIFKNAAVFLENRFVTCDVAVEDGKIAAIGHHLGDGMDCTGLKLLPGLVDIHTHGCAGYDFDHADNAQLTEMSACYLRHGVTAVLATLMTNPRALLLEAAAKCGAAAAPIRGIYLEGPFFGPAKKGAHDARYLTPINGEFFSALDEAAKGAIRIVAVDPCLEGAEDFIRQVSKTKRVALAHTPAGYDDAQKGFAAGATKYPHNDANAQAIAINANEWTEVIYVTDTLEAGKYAIGFTTNDATSSATVFYVDAMSCQKVGAPSGGNSNAGGSNTGDVLPVAMIAVAVISAGALVIVARRKRED